MVIFTVPVALMVCELSFGVSMMLWSCKISPPVLVSTVKNIMGVRRRIMNRNTALS